MQDLLKNCVAQLNQQLNKNFYLPKNIIFQRWQRLNVCR
jgi:hypothetical protein